MPHLNVLKRYLLSYCGIVLVACIFVGGVLLRLSADELNAEYRHARQTLLDMAVEDLDTRFSALQDIAYTVQVSPYYRPDHLARSKYYEVELLEDFGRYRSTASLCAEYFLLYEGDERVFASEARMRLCDCFAKLNIKTDSDQVGMDISGLRRFDIIAVNDDWLLAAYPIRFTATDDRATMCFLIPKQTLRAHMDTIAIERVETLQILFGEKILIGKDSESGAYLQATRGAFTLMSPVETQELWRGFTTFGLWIIALFVVAFVALGALMAYRSYRPIRVLYEKVGGGNTSDELDQISSGIQRLFDENRASLRLLDRNKELVNDLRTLLRRYAVLMLLINGGKASSEAQLRASLGDALRAKRFRVLLIDGCGDCDELVRRVEASSSERVRFMPVCMVHAGLLAILVNTDEEGDEGPPLSWLDASAIGARGLVASGRYADTRIQIPDSLLSAMSAYEADAGIDQRELRAACGGVTAALCDRDEAGAMAALNALDDALRAKDCTPFQCALTYARLCAEVARVARKENWPMEEGMRPEPLWQSADAIAREIRRSIASLCDHAKARRMSLEEAEAHAAAQYVRDHVCDWALSQEQVAEALGMSVRKVSALVQRDTGMLYRDYVNAVRMEEAQRLLLATDLSVGEISEQVCYASVAHFIKTFKRATGYTPLSYRANKRI